MSFEPLEAELAARRAADLYRQRRVTDGPQGADVEVGGRRLVNFCSNDYLGLAGHPDLVAAAQAGAARWGVGSGASHLVCGHSAAHEAMEARLASFVGKPAALSFSTGYMANLAAVSALVGRGDAVFADKLNHASLNDACQLSHAAFKRFAHNDLAQLERLLATTEARRRLIVVDAVFSMDGDCAPLAEIMRLAERYDAWVYVDDAHGFGVLGDGHGSTVGLDSPRLIYMATLGKAAGVAGAFIAAEAVVIDYLINTARPYIYTTAAPALLAEAVLASVDLIEREHWRRDALAAHIAMLRSVLGPALLPSATPIQPAVVADSAAALQRSAQLYDAGLWVAAIRPPTVPTPRLRICLSAAHRADDVARLGALLAQQAEPPGLTRLPAMKPAPN
ncbi:8-amino-7-oxononanoate synthase [Jeongeupia chitinilytica]|uniref:8-amino-7-oxononanoate synthase n=1 Tax=Jeongeupia chitinilytica TaxID=1041641 RepID=A0ABQ3H4R7_9NEIS|nr:8-amino-7-oxononanoate synthase [Jeongeupia chitinilytica]GHD67245.1 8-amino-7-oxononanoate synthase [Jeongeupia chitinilytica]